MPLGSQVANVELMNQLTGLTHDIYVGSVVNAVKRMSPTSSMFQDAGPGEYRLEGQAMVFATDLRFKTGGIATDGKLPDYTGLDAVQGKIQPTRRYNRIALDNLVEKQASGPGAFEDLGDRIFDKLWDSQESMEIRHAIGSASGLIATVSARTSSTVFTVTGGYGNAGTNPIQHLAEGSIIGWYDVNVAAVGGAARIASIDYDTNEITVDSAATWEPTNVIAVSDLIYFASAPNTTREYFTLERNLAPNGLGTIVDPNGALTTVFNISETTYPRWKPYRQDSITFDHIELTEHWLKLAAKRGMGVTPSTDVALAYPSVVAQLARSLMGLQQQAYTGATLKGGWTGVTVRNMEVVEDHHFYHNAVVTCHRDKLFRINLGGDADFWDEDGSMWARTANYDGKDAYVVDYMNTFSPHRGAHAVLGSIVTDVNDNDWAPVPNY